MMHQENGPPVVYALLQCHRAAGRKLVRKDEKTMCDHWANRRKRRDAKLRN